MNTFLFVGRLAGSVDVRYSAAGTPVAKFTLISNEYAGKDEQGAPKERTTSIAFVAFGGKAEAIGKHCHKGDQLILDARVENHHYTDNDGVERYGFNFVVEGFDFGAPGAATREQLSGRKEHPAAAK